MRATSSTGTSAHAPVRSKTSAENRLVEWMLLHGPAVE